jgi:hypothetical protein
MLYDAMDYVSQVNVNIKKEFKETERELKASSISVEKIFGDGLTITDKEIEEFKLSVNEHALVYADYKANETLLYNSLSEDSLKFIKNKENEVKEIVIGYEKEFEKFRDETRDMYFEIHQKTYNDLIMADGLFEITLQK